MKDLSLEGMYTYLHKNMDTGLTRIDGKVDLSNVTTTRAFLIDNPYQGIGFGGGYDYKLKRAWIVKQGEFTLSYDVLMQAWAWFHSYQPKIIIPFDNRVFFVNNDIFWEMNTGSKGSYFGEVYDSELEFIVRVPVASVYNNQVHSCDITNGPKVRDAFWDTF